MGQIGQNLRPIKGKIIESIEESKLTTAEKKDFKSFIFKHRPSRFVNATIEEKPSKPRKSNPAKIKNHGPMHVLTSST